MSIKLTNGILGSLQLVLGDSIQKTYVTIGGTTKSLVTALQSVMSNIVIVIPQRFGIVWVDDNRMMWITDDGDIWGGVI